jgi:hypothetical protein
VRTSGANRDASQRRDAGAATRALVPEAEAGCGVAASQCDGELGTANPVRGPVASELSRSAPPHQYSSSKDPDVVLHRSRPFRRLSKQTQFAVTENYAVLSLHEKMLTWDYQSAFRIETARLAPGRAVGTHSASLSRSYILCGSPVRF